jgi:hypothetical protein
VLIGRVCLPHHLDLQHVYSLADTIRGSWCALLTSACAQGAFLREGARPFLFYLRASAVREPDCGLEPSTPFCNADDTCRGETETQ